jgi:hypothetical protein
MVNMKFTEQFKAARRVSTPLIAVCTPDPAATVQSIAALVGTVPMLAWDCVRGLVGLNEMGTTAMAGIDAAATVNLVETLATAARLPKQSVVFISNAHEFVKEAPVAQGIWNLRDEFKTDKRTLVLLAPQITLPTQLQQDVVILDEPLPTDAELAEIVKSCFSGAQLPAPKPEIIAKAVDATCGLASFPAEQVIAMSLSKSAENNIDLDGLWDLKRKTIEQAQGLSVYRGKETLDDVVGLPNISKFMKTLANSKKRYRGIVFMDEVDKHVANFGAVGTGDTTAEMLGPVLSLMEDEEIDGILLAGVAGCGKTLISKAFGNDIGAPTMIYDFSGMKASHVGESGANVRNANKVAMAVTQGKLLFIATCNNVAVLPTEFRRRFTLGTFFFDLPTREGRDQSWKLYEKKYSIKKQTRPNDEGWTPAEIRNCCRTASDLGLTLVESAKYIVPVAKSGAKRIEQLRQEANGAYLDTVNEGLYQIAASKKEVSTRSITAGE